ncbi:hypothetical protein BC624_10567 [Flavobacterium granuli]|uniref:Uncharacterized protein n=1 Tax=Flavobacterium granuli TaxID=280093 RepID=A0A1M5NNJ7_9FLAO|nr:hypothetical protein BC624_10567 [Flavobacterium granuli]SHG91067.1 hypothetical protein SAMN05443373_10567 [Flavobacterium granuli]
MGGLKYLFTYIYTIPSAYVIITMTLIIEGIITNSFIYLF